MKNSIKLAVAVCGLVGSISFNPNAEMEYLEDDSLFSKTTAQLVHGWEWGLSSAHADMDVICCGWLPPGWDDYYGGSGGGGGSAGGDASNDYNYGQEDAEYLEDICVGDAKHDLNKCTSLANGTAILTAGLCAGFVNPVFVIACGTVAAYGGVIGNFECNDAFISAEFACKS